MEKNENGSTVRPSESDLSLAMVYSPVQRFVRLYDPDSALEHGTLFEELYKPLLEEC